MTDFYWGLFATTGSIDAYMEYRNCSDRFACNGANDEYYNNTEELNEDLSRHWHRSEDDCGWRIE